MKKIIFAAAAALLITTAGSHAQVVLLAGYDFQTLPGTAAAAPTAATPAPNVYTPSFGTELATAALYLNGTNGSSSFVNTLTGGTEVSAFGGTAVNAGTGFSTTTASPSALALLGGATTPTANGKTAVFTLSMTGFQGLVLTFATQRTATGFTGNTFSYSTDGINFTLAGISIAPATAFAVATADFSAITALNNAATVYIGYTLAGATAAAGNNRLDNIQFNATTIGTGIPEPATYAYVLGGLGALALGMRRRTS